MQILLMKEKELILFFINISFQDHHKDMWLSNLKVKKKIELVGSCSTLVAEKLLPLEILDSQMAYLLLGTILLDTINLDPRAGRSTHKDIEIVKQLQDKYPVDLDELYTALSQGLFRLFFFLRFFRFLFLLLPLC